MAEYEAPIEDALEQVDTVPDVEDPTTLSEIDEVELEATDADVVEQHTPAGAQDYAAAPTLAVDANEADVSEQSVVVEYDEDDYR